MLETSDFNPKNVAIFLITSYPKWYLGKLKSLKHSDKIRGDLALELIEGAAGIGYQVVVADWNSPKTFHKHLKLVPRVIILRRRSSKASLAKRLALKKASQLPDVKVIVLTEPEKVSLIKSIPALIKPILQDRADIIVPKRNDGLFRRTYPFYQYESEKEGNNAYNEELKSHRLIDINDNFDMFFGPRVISNTKSLISLFMKRYHFKITNTSFPKTYFDPEEMSNTNFFPVVAALKRGSRVKSIEIPFEYPLLQKQNEEKDSRDFFVEKRKAQRIGLIIELLYFIR